MACLWSRSQKRVKPGPEFFWLQPMFVTTLLPTKLKWLYAVCCRILDTDLSTPHIALHLIPTVTLWGRCFNLFSFHQLANWESEWWNNLVQIIPLESTEWGFKHRHFSSRFHAQFSSAQSLSHLCDPMNHSTPGLPVHHQLPEFTQTHVHRVSDAIQPSHPLSSPSPLAPNPSQHQGLFKRVSSSHQVAKVLEFQLQHQSSQWIFRMHFL